MHGWRCGLAVLFAWKKCFRSVYGILGCWHEEERDEEETQAGGARFRSGHRPRSTA
jgi:hypothetical protein